MPEFKYEIKEEIEVLSQTSRGWQKELNFVSFGDHEPKYDIRDWAPEHARMGKGVTLTLDELVALRDALNNMNLDEDSFE